MYNIGGKCWWIPNDEHSLFIVKVEIIDINEDGTYLIDEPVGHEVHEDELMLEIKDAVKVLNLKCNNWYKLHNQTQLYQLIFKLKDWRLKSTEQYVVDQKEITHEDFISLFPDKKENIDWFKHEFIP